MNHNIRIEGMDIEQVSMFEYLGGTINSSLEVEIDERLSTTGC